MSRAAARLPAFAEFVLTRRLPCAALAVIMFTAILWLPATGALVPAFASPASVLAFLIHLLTPGLFALVFFGGGSSFALQSGLIAAIAAGLVNFSLLPGLAMFVLYVVFPVSSGYILMLPRGLERSAYSMAAGLGILILLILLLAAGSANMSLQEYSDHLLAPFFTPLTEQIPAGEDGQLFLQAIKQMRETSSLVFPGSMTIFVWLVWMGSTLLARRLASRFGFYEGSAQPLASIRFNQKLAMICFMFLLGAMMLGGTLQYLTLNAGIVLAGLFAMQGLAVTYVWLSARKLRVLNWFLYPMLLMQPVMIFPFLIIGLFDVWFDYRGKINPVIGGK